MAKYEFVTLNIHRFIGAGGIEHRTIIQQYASKGYKYVGYIPINIDSYGKFKEIDLIFEVEE